MKKPMVFASMPIRPDELVPARSFLLEYLPTALERLATADPDQAECRRRRERLHLMVHSAQYEGKLSTTEADLWRDRIDRRYEEVTGQPAPPRPDNPLADLA